jgi:PAS domain S-box-containing protein
MPETPAGTVFCSVRNKKLPTQSAHQRCWFDCGFELINPDHYGWIDNGRNRVKRAEKNVGRIEGDPVPSDRTQEEQRRRLSQLETEQTRTQLQIEALEEAREFAESVMQTIREPLLVLDRDLLIVAVNRAMCGTFGATAAETKGQPFSWLLGSHCGGPELLPRLQAVVAEDKTIENHTIECQLGEMGKRFMLVNARRLSRDHRKPPFVLLALQDVTERKQTEEALSRNQNNLEDFFQNAPVGLHWAGADGRILWANQRELDMLGYSREEYVGRFLSDFHDDQAGIKDFIHRLAKGEQVEKFESRVRRKDGALQSVAICANALWENGAFVHTRCFTLDITEQKHAEESLKNLNFELEVRVASRTAALQQSNDEMEAFCYTIAHDLRAPLRAMEGFAQALLEDCGDRLNDTGRDYARRIIKAARREDKLIQDLLEYSQLKLTPLTSSPVVLEQAVQNAVACFHDAIQDQKARVQVYPPFPEVMGNAATLNHVLAHLISNGLKFVESGVQPKIRIWAEKRQSTVRLWIEDNGIGIQPEHHDRIFRVFERLHHTEQYPGTGIGLAMVRRGIERMGGTVGVESSPGKGSRFWLELPA